MTFQDTAQHYFKRKEGDLVKMMAWWAYPEDTEHSKVLGRVLLGVKVVMSLPFSCSSPPLFFFTVGRLCYVSGKTQAIFSLLLGAFWSDFPGYTLPRNDCTYFLTSSLTNGNGVFSHQELQLGDVFLTCALRPRRHSLWPKGSLLPWRGENMFQGKKCIAYSWELCSILERKIVLEEVVCHWYFGLTKKLSQLDYIDVEQFFSEAMRFNWQRQIPIQVK